MKKLILIILTVLLLMQSCQKDTVANPGEDEPLPTVLFSLKNKEGVSLVDQSFTHDFDKVKIFFGIANEKVRANKCQLSFPTCYYIDKSIYEPSIYSIKVTLNSNLSSLPAVTYIDFADGDTDTIKGIYNKVNEDYIYEKIWYNDSLVWNIDINKEKYPHFEIIK